MKVSISPGNTKMGAVPSVSLPPVITCPAGAPCAGKCYAARMCKRRKNVREAYARNLEIYNADPAAFELQVKAAASMTRFFRWHVAGDILNPVYFEMMVRIARDLPHTEFLAFTKKYGIVNAYIAQGGEIPANLHIIFSEWGDGWKVPNPHDFPTSAVIFKGTEPRDDWKVCPGHCADCAARGVGCWELKAGETIAFYEH